MANLIDLVKGHFTDELVARMGPFLGVDAEKAHKIADAVIPALLGAVTSKAGDGGVLELIKSFVGNGFDFGKVWSPAGGLVGLVEAGHPIVNTLFGDHVKESVSAVAKAAGTTDHEARKALNLTAPGLLGTLASSLGAGVTVAGLAGLLDANKDAIAEKAGGLGLPFDVKGAIAGLAGLAGVSGAATSVVEVPNVDVEVSKAPKAAKRITVGDVEEVKEAVVAPAAAAVPAAAAASIPVKSVEVPGDAEHKIAAVAGNLPSVSTPAVKGSPLALMAILGVGLIGLFLAMKGCPAIPAGVAPAEEPHISAMASPEPKIEEPAMPTAPEVTAPAAPAPEVKMDANVAVDGVEAKLVEFIKSDKPVDKTTWFTFDRLYFDTSKASLKPESETQLKNIVEIMKAYPAVKLKIGGYTDNQGADAYNMKLSADRANTTMQKLVGMGVDGSRLAAEGYGKEHPVADNATEEGRAKNRRIDVRVTAK